jgi:hypothetical protein
MLGGTAPTLEPRENLTTDGPVSPPLTTDGAVPPLTLIDSLYVLYRSRAFSLSLSLSLSRARALSVFPSFFFSPKYIQLD